MDGHRTSGDTMHQWASDLMPLPRSLTGDGVRRTLERLTELMPGLDVHEVPSGTPAFDWVVPDEWNLRRAVIEDQDGRCLVDTADNLLHVVGYSEPIDMWVSREELDAHLHSLPDQPDAIPYVTSYYERTWGFCVRHADRERLGDGPFRVVIDATLEPGHLTYADLLIPGESDDEVLLTTYVCHPNLANNELSGPVVLAALTTWLRSLESRHYSYRIVVAPETIGSLLYLSRHLSHLKDHVVAGWVLTCMGDDRDYSYMPSRLGGTLSDRVSLRALTERGAFTHYSWIDRGSDERQWCAPGADLPVCSVMRTKYGRYPEYHTSLDDLTHVVTPAGLAGALDIMIDCLELLESNRVCRSTVIGEPQMGRRGLYATTSTKAGQRQSTKDLMDVLTYCDGDHDLLRIADSIDRPWRAVRSALATLTDGGLVEATHPVRGRR